MNTFARRLAALFVALAALIAYRPAGAEEPAPASLGFEFDAGASGLEQTAVSAAIERELGVKLGAGTSDAASLQVALTEPRHAVVTFRSSSGAAVTRDIDLPEDPAQASDAIALLAGNLSRDEAAEILRELERAAAKPTPPPAPVPAPKKPASKPPTKRPAIKDAEPEPDAELPLRFAANVSVWGDLSVLGDVSRQRLLLDLNFAYAHLGAVSGVEIGLGYADIEEWLKGAAFEVGWVTVRKRVYGALVAVGGTSAGELKGVQVAVGANTISGKVKGAQIAAGCNCAGGDVEGLQAAGGVNRAASLKGVQAGLVNIGGDVTGGQFGLINVAGHVRGTQIGLVNVSDRVEGVPIGLVNAVSKGRTQVAAWGDSNGFANLGVRYLTAPIYTLLGVGWGTGGFGRAEQDALALSAGIGGEIRFGEGWAADLDAVYSSEQGPDFQNQGPTHVGRYRLSLVRDLVSEAVAVFASGGLEHSHPRDADVTVRAYAAAGVLLF